jgi:hypothetical protein
MSRDDLIALIARVEAATADEQPRAMLAVVDALNLPNDPHRRVVNMIYAEAYESAAMTLVPEGWRVYRMERLSCAPDAEWRADIIKTYGSVGQNARASHLALALALTAAALRARLAQMGDGA